MTSPKNLLVFLFVTLARRAIITLTRNFGEAKVSTVDEVAHALILGASSDITRKPGQHDTMWQTETTPPTGDHK
jgi:hypothetical protein